MVAVTAWTLAYALVLTSVDLSLKLLFSKAMYVGVVLVPVVWLLFVLEYTGRSIRPTWSNLTLVGLLGRVGRRNYLTRRNLETLDVVPLVTLGLVWTNGAHGLIWSDVGLSTAAGFTMGPM